MATRTISRRRLVGGGAFAAGLALLAACGGGAPPTVAPTKPAEKPAAGAAASTQAAAPTQAAAAPAAKAGATGRQTVVLWDPGGDWKRIGPYWTEQTAQKGPVDLKVETVSGDMAAKLLAAFTGGGAPDIFRGKVAAYAGAIDAADPFPAELNARFERDVVKGIAQFYKAKGVWHGYPVSADLGMMLLYNTDHFKEVGLDPAKPPTTMTELREYAVKLTKNNDKGELVRPGHTIRATVSPVGIADKFLPYLHAFGGRVYSDDATKASGFLNGPESIRALEYVTGLVTKDKVANPQLGLPEEQFAAGVASMCFRESWFVGAMKERGPNVKFETALLPRDKEYPGVSLFFSHTNMVYKKSTVKDAAFKWFDFIATDEHDLAIAKLENYLPVHTNNYKDAYVQERRDAKVINQILTAPAGPYYDHPRVNEIADRIGRGIEEAALGRKAPKEALDGAAVDVDKIMARK